MAHIGNQVPTDASLVAYLQVWDGCGYPSAFWRIGRSELLKKAKAPPGNPRKSRYEPLWTCFETRMSVTLRLQELQEYYSPITGIKHANHNRRHHHDSRRPAPRKREPGPGIPKKTISAMPNPPRKSIRRLWKFFRKKVINTVLYRPKEKFKQAIRYLFDNIAAYKEKLEAHF